jgi:hypothetical protein
MTASRAVRIPRNSSAEPTPRPLEVERRALPAEGADIRRWPNSAGSQRAIRLTLIYLLALTLLYLTFVLYDRSVPGGTSSASENGFLLFSVFALVLGVGGAIFSLSPAPRAVELGPDTVVVLGRWGRRTEWTPRDRLSIRTVRRYPAGMLSREPVEYVELSLRGERVRSYLVSEGLFGISPERR